MKYSSSHTFSIVFLGVFLLSLGPANALVYDFDYQVWGNSSILLNNAAGRETFVEITENIDTPANDVLFKFTNTIPPENTEPFGEAAIPYIYFDTGDYTDLITEVNILEQSVGVAMTIPSGRPTMEIINEFDTFFTEDFSIGKGSGFPANKHENGINPGEYIVLNVTLGAGKSFNDLINALNVGRNADQNIARTGFRISEIVHRIWGNSADADHAAFVVSNAVSLQITAISATPALLLDSQTSQLSVLAIDSEPGPSALSYEWMIVSGGGILDDSTSATPLYTPEDVVGTQLVTLQVEVTDGANTVSDTLNLQVDDADAPPPNLPPEITSITALPANLLDTTTSDLSVVASDPDDNPQALSYQWTIVSGDGILDDATLANPIFTPADVVGTQTVTLQITVSDGEAQVSSNLTLTVEDANPPPPGAELLFEDFSSGSLAGWSVNDDGTPASNWGIVSGQLAQLSSTNDGSSSGALTHLGTYLSYDDGLGWTGYKLRFSMLTTGDDDTLGVMFRIRDANNYYRFTWDMQRKQRRLVKNVGGVFTLLAADNVPYVINQTYQVEVVTQGEQLEVWIDGVRIFQVTDSDHNYGTFAFQTWLHKAAYFDDVQVEDLSGGMFNAIPQIASVTASPANLLDTEFSDLFVEASDPDDAPQALSYQWTIISGGGILDDATVANPLYTPADIVGTQTVTLQVTVSDGEAPVSSNLTLTVEDANPPPLGAELLFEDFSSGSLAGWSVNDDGTPASNWGIVSGQLAQHSSTNDGSSSGALTHLGTYLSYDDGLGWTGYKLRFSMLTTGDDDTLGVMFRIRDANNYYRFTWDMQRKQRRLVKNVGGVFTLLAADNVPYVINQTYQVEVVTQGEQLEVWIDGVRIFQVTDSDHNYGTFAFQTWLHKAAYFDDVQINAMD